MSGDGGPRVVLSRRFQLLVSEHLEKVERRLENHDAVSNTQVEKKDRRCE